METFLLMIAEQSKYFMPHGHCYLWIPSILWMHVISDLLIGVAYMLISSTLLYIVHKLKVALSPVLLAFGLFIFLCGLTHFMEIWTVWNPDYVTAGFVKIACAAASVATAGALLFKFPAIMRAIKLLRDGKVLDQLDT
jgi:hypothetical protein